MLRDVLGAKRYWLGCAGAFGRCLMRSEMKGLVWVPRSEFRGRVIKVFTGEGLDSVIPVPDDEIICDCCYARVEGDPVPVYFTHALCNKCLEGMKEEEEQILEDLKEMAEAEREKQKAGPWWTKVRWGVLGVIVWITTFWWFLLCGKWLWAVYLFLGTLGVAIVVIVVAEHWSPPCKAKKPKNKRLLPPWVRKQEGGN